MGTLSIHLHIAAYRKLLALQRGKEAVSSHLFSFFVRKTVLLRTVYYELSSLFVYVIIIPEINTIKISE